ncbi:MAG: radical SAM protein [Thermoguttaceae bacterium]|jgi:wyosine [tRNA(Phe)-imidazoG37] synthetase (radical SAM superfamily)
MKPSPETTLFQSHPRSYEANRFVYPVLSRRAHGLSIGINLNPEKSCNFDCVYCQVEHSTCGGAAMRPADLPQLAEELDQMIDLVLSGRIFEGGPLRGTPEPLRRLNDIALSGDGEPTASPLFAEVVGLCAEVRRARGLDQVKIIVITNASLLDREPVRRALAVLDANHGEIWAKLDAGSEAYYRKVARSRVTFQRILDNLRETALGRPIVIQSLFMRLGEQPPPAEEQELYCRRLLDIVAGGGRIKLVQVHTIARLPAESFASPLANEEVDAMAELVRRRTGLPVAAFYGG